MPSAANPRRFSIATLGLIAFAHAQAALGADGDTTGNFETVRAWTDTIGRFNKAIADKITEITSFGSDYYKIGMVFMTYGEVVRAFSAAPYAIATTLQTATLGSDDAFAPMVYLIKVGTNISFR